MVEKTLLNERILCFVNRIKEYGIPYRFPIVIFLIWLLGTGTFFGACFILVKKRITYLLYRIRKLCRQNAKNRL